MEVLCTHPSTHAESKSPNNATSHPNTFIRFDVLKFTNRTDHLRGSHTLLWLFQYTTDVCYLLTFTLFLAAVERWGEKTVCVRASELEKGNEEHRSDAGNFTVCVSCSHEATICLVLHLRWCESITVTASARLLHLILLSWPWIENCKSLHPN